MTGWTNLRDKVEGEFAHWFSSDEKAAAAFYDEAESLIEQSGGQVLKDAAKAAAENFTASTGALVDRIEAGVGAAVRVLTQEGLPVIEAAVRVAVTVAIATYKA